MAQLIENHLNIHYLIPCKIFLYLLAGCSLVTTQQFDFNWFFYCIIFRIIEMKNLFPILVKFKIPISDWLTFPHHLSHLYADRRHHILDFKLTNIF